ncbi:hypothetical protein L1987_63640 [Smallanthus sonchifolius]|uniref:Uncharacterized protein n=1 Tax=Smallanthus sonchifolius TaxID=185202 RepID=A0ACB9CDW8_9ASTR|nr:hypothetical protein L1987_63640 [Smallanthus sonchifolius]
MSQTVVLEQNAVETQSITLKFDGCSSDANPSPIVNPENQSITIKFDDQASNHHTIPVSIPNVDSETEAAVNEFLRKHGSSDEESVRTDAMNDLWSFIERQEIGTVVVLVKFASDVKNFELLEIFCQRVADVIAKKTVEEVREIFNIANDFTPEEEQAIRDEHRWAFED